MNFQLNKMHFYVGLALALVAIYFALKPNSNSQEIGKFIEVKRMVTLKRTSGFTPVQKQSMVFAGDVIATQEASSAELQMRSGEKIKMEENSLLAIRKTNDHPIPDFQLGDFILEIIGITKIAVQGKIVVIDGHRSQIAIHIGVGQQPEMKVVSGDALIPNDFLKVASPRKTQTSPFNLVSLDQIDYIWKLYDLYDRDGHYLFLKPHAIDQVSAHLNVTWSGPPQPAFIQLSSSAVFDDAPVIETGVGSYRFESLNLGLNFWRVSLDKTNWSQAKMVQVKGGFLKAGRPVAFADQREIIIQDQIANVKITLGSSIPLLGYIVEFANDERFSQGPMRTYLTNKPNFNLQFAKPGIYYYRFRGVSPSLELTEWSDPVKFHAELAPPPMPPILMSQNQEGFLGDSFNMNFKSELPTEIEVVGPKGDTVARFPAHKAEFVPLAPGRYKAFATAKNKFGKTSPPSKAIDITVNEKQIVSQPPKPQKLARKPAGQNQEVLQVMKLDSTRPSDTFRDTHLGFRGFLARMQSTQQYLDDLTPPVASGIGFRGEKWWNHSGVEVILKNQVLALNSSATSMSFFSLEPRYHYRFSIPPPFSITRDLQISLFTGHEFASNTSSSFSNKYDLQTFGTALEFPVGENWGAGGELALGYGFDGSTKYIISGKIDYFFSKKWSASAGYLLQLFEAGSKNAAPYGSLPYREGYTELFTTIDFHF